MNIDEETIELGFDGPPAAFARMLPSQWKCPSDALEWFERGSNHPIPLGRVGGMSWGPAAGGFLVSRWNENIQANQVTNTATRWFRASGEFWGVDSRFIGINTTERFFATGYAAERWKSWLEHHHRLCRTLGGSGAILVKLGIVGLTGTRWPRGTGGQGPGPRALEDEAFYDFALEDSDNVDEEIQAGVEAMMLAASSAYGL